MIRNIIFFTLSIIFSISTYAQTFNTTAGGAIPDATAMANGANTCFPITVSGLPTTINGTTFGLQSVCVTITHPFVSDLVVYIKAPDGTQVPLIYGAGDDGANFTNTCLSMSAPTSIDLQPNTAAPFTGSFTPSFPMGWVNNGQNPNGTWSICVQDFGVGDAGSFVSGNITFGNTPAPRPVVPTCTSTNLTGGNQCEFATTICNNSSYCGVTNYNFYPTNGTNFNVNVCTGTNTGTAQFYRFIPTATTAAFNITVGTPSAVGPNDGINILITSQGCSNTITSAITGCNLAPNTSTNLTTPATLVVGTTYYLMVVGRLGAIVPYTINTISGFNVINILPNDTAICAGSPVTLTASNATAPYTWNASPTLNTTSGATVIATPTTTTVYTVNATSFANPQCPATAPVEVVVLPRPATPTGSVTVQPNCTTPTGTIVITAPSGATIQYSLTGAAGSFQTSGTFTNVSPGIYANVVVRNTTTGCTSLPITLTVAAAPTPPAAPTASVTVQPTCAVPTGTIVVTVPTGANFTYSINGVTYQTSTTFAGVAPGTYPVTVRNTTTNCTSTATSLIVNAVPAAPVPATVTVTAQPTCAVNTGTITVTAPTGASLQYSINGTTYQAGLTFLGLTPGNYPVTVQNTTNGCTSTIVNVTINAIPSPPAAPTATVSTQPSCAIATGTITITAPTGATFEYSINGATYQLSNIFTGLVANTYNVTVRNTITGCVSTPTVLTINAAPTPPNAPTASVTQQPTCATPTGTITITAPTGANLEYSVNGTTYQPGLTFVGLAANTYNVTVRNTVTNCVSTATVLIVNAAAGAPAAPTATATLQPTCTINTGTITVTAPIGANLEYSIDNSSYQAGLTFALLPSGIYLVTVRNTVTGCTSTATNVTINTQPATPVSPTATVTTQPNCTVNTGTIAVTAPTGATLTYSIDGTTYQSSTTFTGVASGTYNVTVRNTVSGCTSNAISIIVNPVPTPPATPTTSVTAQPTCTISTGTITITAPTGATLQYSINGSTYQTSTTFTGVASGTYTVTVLNTANGCVSNGTNLTVNTAPAPAAAPTASATVQPNCTVATGTIVISAPTGANFEYSIDGTNYQASPTFAGLNSNTYSVTVRNTVSNCISASASVTINPAPAPTAAPVGLVTQQPNCIITTGTITINTPLGVNLQYSINGTTYQTSPIITGLAPNTYNVTVRNTVTGCVSTPLSLTINPAANTVPAPSVTIVLQPNCLVQQGTLNVTAPLGLNLVYSIDGVTYLPSPIFTGLTPGTTYQVRVRDILTGCVSAPTPAIITALPNNSPEPLADDDVEYCKGDPAVALVAIGSNLLWYTTPTGGIPSLSAPIPNTTNVGSTIYYVSQVALPNCESNRLPILVTIFDKPTVNAGPDKTIFAGQVAQLNGSVTPTLGTTYLWTPNNVSNTLTPNVSPIFTQDYTLTATNTDGCRASDVVNVKVFNQPEIPNAFSPNGDGINDVWNVKYLTQYPTASVEIYNRYGQQVFVSTGYANPWKGTYTNGQPLPVGTYYYIINLNQLKAELIKGSVSIIR